MALQARWLVSFILPEGSGLVQCLEERITNARRISLTQLTVDMYLRAIDIEDAA